MTPRRKDSGELAKRCSDLRSTYFSPLNPKCLFSQDHGRHNYASEVGLMSVRYSTLASDRPLERATRRRAVRTLYILGRPSRTN